MALIVMRCEGVNWQEDFTRIVPNLFLYYGKVFKIGNDREEKVWNAILFFMESFSRKWKSGEQLHLTTVYAAKMVKRGSRFLRMPGGLGGKSVKAQSNKSQTLVAIRARLERRLAWIDYRLLLERMDHAEATIVSMVVQGFTLEEIAKTLHKGKRTIKRAILTALNLLK